ARGPRPARADAPLRGAPPGTARSSRRLRSTGPPGRRAVVAPMIEEAEATLGVASRAGKPGRFQLEAAIQSAHARRAATGRTDWESIALLYEGLLRCAPTIGAQVGYAAALAEVRGAQEGL